ncbi:hypothetical protein NM688_g1054 [Phlebia brevispora]|uniref:Uncharacterized protein n=1 Tax=Phlebia brevispora TaxID=194682 RepID=A0ACC1TCX9_9APHY|nr:hypothetical protein NM688_g1054 [Phlebia brevispora]
MSLARVLVTCTQTAFYQAASTPPNKTPTKARYDIDHPWHIRIAAVVFRLQQPLLWIATGAELLLALAQQTVVPLPASLSRTIQHNLCAYPRSLAWLPVSKVAPNLHATPLAVLGAALVVCGSVLRLTCFRKLGTLFTFDLTILPSHELITTGPYAYVRHPAYAGTLLMCIGMLLVNFTPGSWVTECGIMGHGLRGTMVRTAAASLWLGWWLSVGVHRCRSEDAELRKIFQKVWDSQLELICVFNFMCLVQIDAESEERVGAGEPLEDSATMFERYVFTNESSVPQLACDDVALAVDWSKPDGRLQNFARVQQHDSPPQWQAALLNTTSIADD